MVDTTNSELLEDNPQSSESNSILLWIKSKTVEKVDALINQKHEQFVQYQKDDQ